MQVFKGQDLRTGELVAIKQLQVSGGGLSAESMASVMGEIELLKNLNHENIVKYIGYYKTRSHLYIILEYMENGALSSVIRPQKFGVFDEYMVAVYIAQVLQASSCCLCFCAPVESGGPAAALGSGLADDLPACCSPLQVVTGCHQCTPFPSPLPSVMFQPLALCDSMLSAPCSATNEMPRCPA